MATNISEILNLEHFAEFGENASFVHELYVHYKTDPTLVGTEWAEFFCNFEANNLNTTKLNHSLNVTGSVSPESTVSVDLVKKQGEVSRLIDTYRSIGHFNARLNPLSKGIVLRPIKEELLLDNFSLTSDDMSTPFFTHGLMAEGTASLKEIFSKLQYTYTGSIGFEYMHLTEEAERDFLREKIEGQGKREFSLEERKTILKVLSDAESLEHILHKRFIGSKRFSLEGSETASPAIVFAIDKLAQLGTKKVRIGMAHRGRLSTAVNICGKPLSSLICEFEDNTIFSTQGFGDVKYHLGAQTTFTGLSGNPIEIYLANNPSHLEFVNPVVTGQVRADQDLYYNQDRTKSCAFLIHGDAAFAGQGVVFETLNFTDTKGYDVGGTVHLVINNQLGFTATEDESRGTTYCTDLSKGINAPVFHVNSEDIESCIWISELACEFRQKFGRDVIIDLIGYRKYGHNEGDDPTFTQPLMYEQIKTKTLLSDQYVEYLKSLKIDLSQELENYRQEYEANFEKATENAKSFVSNDIIKFDPQTFPENTAVNKESLFEIADNLVTIPPGFTPHNKLYNLLKKRASQVRIGEGIEWGVSEGLAFGSLLQDGFYIRVSGQDSARGTFSHRHAILDSSVDMNSVCPFDFLPNSKGKFVVYNSVLSECGVLGFEYGFSNIAQKSLVIWEAQFGDFANGAQVIIDQFIASGEVKWNMNSAVVLLLPHGFEGQGPEHSSSRLERFLQLCADNNLAVYFPSNGAQYFHILRRQAYASIKRPAIVMTPKSLLRLPDAGVTIEQLCQDSFHPIICEIIGDKNKAKSSMILSGKIYYEVKSALIKNNLSAKVIRIEQLYPFPIDEIKNALSKDKDVIYVQEEPKNQGAFSFVSELLTEELGLNPKYFGRPKTATTSCGSNKRHQYEQKLIIESVLNHLNK